VTTPTIAYTDLYQWTLTTSHRMSSRAEVWYDGAKVLDLQIVSGAVDADRTAVARRTTTIVVDGSYTSAAALNHLDPFGSQLYIFRTVHFADNTKEETRVFYGRIESVQVNGQQVTISAADLAVKVVDYKLPKAKTYAEATPFYDVIADLLAFTGQPIHVLGAFPAILLRAPLIVDDDRVAAIDDLLSQVGWQWFVNTKGEYWLTPLPGTIPTTAVPVWTVDAGSTGVLVQRAAVRERTGISNFVIVRSESPRNHPIMGYWLDDNVNSPTYVAGPFGRVTRVFTVRQLTNASACRYMAFKYLRLLITQVNAITVECIPNQRLGLEDIIEVKGTDHYDGLYYVTGFTLPLVPNNPMLLQAAKAVIEDPADASFANMEYTVGESETTVTP
jgi:hypothetical protein